MPNDESPRELRAQNSAATIVRQLADKFASRLSSGESVRIEDILTRGPAAVRTRLLKVLLRIELEFLQRQGGTVVVANYQQRFPADSDVVDEVLSGLGSGDVPAGDVSPTVPTQIGRFRILEFLGAGSFGNVYRAFDPTLDREVALKVLKVEAHGEESIRRFQEEARAAARLQHPNIVAVFESGSADGLHYISADFISGRTLKTRLAAGVPTHRQTAAWLRDLVQGVAYAHEAGIVHRDIKPDNIMVASQNCLKLMDFGLARREIETDASRTREGTILGTPAYMAPEQARGEVKSIGPASDQYSLGAVLYEMLTGRAPYAGRGIAVLADVGSPEREPPRPRSVDNSIPADLEAICQKALHKEIGKRYASCGDFAVDLDNWLHDRPTRARPLTLPARFAKWSRRNPVVAGLTLGLFAVLATSLGVVLSTLTEVQDARDEAQFNLGQSQASERKAQWALKKVEEEARRADRQADLAGESAARADAEAKRATTEADEAKRQERIARIKAYQPLLLLAQQAIDVGDHAEARRLLNMTDPALRGWEWRYLASYLPETVRIAGGFLLRETLAPDGATFLRPRGAGFEQVDVETNAVIWDYRDESGDRPMIVSQLIRFDGTGRRAIVPILPKSSNAILDRSINIVNLETREQERQIKGVWYVGESRAADWLPLVKLGAHDGNRIPGEETALNLVTGEEISLWTGPGDYYVQTQVKHRPSISVDGKRFAHRTHRELAFFDIATRTSVEEPILQKLRVGYESTSRDGRLVAGRVAEPFELNGRLLLEGSFPVIDLVDQRLVSVLTMLDRGPLLATFATSNPIEFPTFQFSADGRIVWVIHATDFRRTAYFWDVASGNPLGVSVANVVLPNGRTMVVPEEFKAVVRQLPLEHPPARHRAIVYPNAQFLTWSNAARLIGTSRYSQQRPSGRKEVGAEAPFLAYHEPWLTLIECEQPQAPGPAVALRDGNQALFARNFPELHFVNPENGQVIASRTLEGEAIAGPILDLHLADQQRQLITVHETGAVQWWDLASGKRLRRFDFEFAAGESQTLTASAVSPDGARLAVTSGNRLIVFDGDRIVFDKGEKSKPFDRVSLSRDGTLLAANQLGNARGGEVTVWNLATGEVLMNSELRVSMSRATNPVTGEVKVSPIDPEQALRSRWTAEAVLFSPTEDRLVTVERETGLRILETTNWEEVLRVPFPPQPIGTLSFSPDGNHLAASLGFRNSAQGSLRLWSAIVPTTESKWE